MHARSKSDVESVAASQHSSSSSGIDSAASTRVALVSPEASRKIVVVVVMLVHVSLANVKAFTDDVSYSHASIRGSSSESSLFAQQMAISDTIVGSPSAISLAFSTSPFLYIVVVTNLLVQVSLE